MDFYRSPTTQGTIDALGSVYRALRIWKFYPKGHPTRRSAVMQSHTAMQQLLDGNDLLLVCGRTGFSFPDGGNIKDTTRLATSLAYELFIRRAQKITFLHDLFQEDLLDFVRILALPPETIKKSGGLDVIMAEHGIRSIWVNESDLAAIRDKRHEIESKGVTPQGFEEAEANGDACDTVEQQSPEADVPPELQLQTLLGRLESTLDEDLYLILVRQAVTCADALTACHQADLTFPLVELLASHAADEFRSENLRDYAQSALDQLAAGDAFLHCVLDRMAEGDGLTKRTLLAVLVAGGPLAVVLAVEQMGITNHLTVRKTISNLLGELGEDAVKTLLDLADDERWFIVRNICSILGSIGSSEAVPGLINCLRHADLRVCKEAIRSLALIGGRESESAIIGILRDKEAALYPQAIASLGGMKCHKALPELMQVLFAKDMFLQSLPLKTDALTAIALIGDRQVTPYLVKLLTERHMLAARRWRRLKTAVAQCLAKLGDGRALATLKELSSHPGEVGTACAEAAVLIEKAGGTPDGIS